MRALALALLFAAPAASAAGLEVSPVVIQLDARTKNAVISLRNGGEEVTRYQVSAFAWGESREGKMELLPTKDVTFYPPVLQLQPGEKRNLRVGALTPFGEVEKTYRVFVEELPPPPEPGKSQVRVLARVGIPVFLAPSKPLPLARIEGLSAARGKVRFAVRNAGNVRVRPAVVTLTALSDTGATVLEKSWEGWYVLAQGARDYEAELPAATCASVRHLAVAANDPEHGTLIGKLDVPAGTACPP